MKNTATSPLNPSWSRALRDFDTAMRTRGMGEKTRRAYGVDVGQLAGWASAHELEPAQLDPRRLRRFAGVLSERGASKSTGAGKLAATPPPSAASTGGWPRAVAMGQAPPIWCRAPSATPTFQRC